MKLQNVKWHKALGVLLAECKALHRTLGCCVNLLSDGQIVASELFLSLSPASEWSYQLCSNLHWDLDAFPPNSTMNIAWTVQIPVATLLHICACFSRTFISQQPSWRSSQQHRTFRSVPPLHTDSARSILWDLTGTFAQSVMEPSPRFRWTLWQVLSRALKWNIYTGSDVTSSRITKALEQEILWTFKVKEHLWTKWWIRHSRFSWKGSTRSSQDCLLRGWNLCSDSDGSQRSLLSRMHSDFHGAFFSNQQPSGTAENPQFTRVSPPRLPHHRKPHSYGTAENNIDQLDNHLFIYTCLKKSRNNADSLCFIVLSLSEYRAALLTCLSCIYCIIYLQQGALFFSLPSCGKVAVDKASQSSTH